MKEQCKTVVVTGAFQYFHEGHKDLLRYANQLGKVIALVNSDESVLERKGWLAENFETRAKNLLDSGMVSIVRKIGNDPTHTLQEIKPDYQVLGNDYTEEQVLGREFIGQVVITPRLDKDNICSSKIRTQRLGESDEGTLRSSNGPRKDNL